MEKIKINYDDFWPEFDYKQDWLYQFLCKFYEVVIDNNPDYLFYSCFGKNHLKYKCYKVFYCGENVRPNYLDCDFSISFDFNYRENHFRLPLYASSVGFEPEELLNKPKLYKGLLKDKKFCCFLASNEKANERIEFFKKLSKYKQVDSGGLVHNNVGFRVTDKMKFIKDYKFIIAFENSSYLGYVTEKIWHPFFVDIMPIYWGSPNIEKDFNTARFVNYHEFSSLDNMINKIIELDNDDEQYLKMVNEPVFINNELNAYCDREELKRFFVKIFSKKTLPVSQTWRFYKSFFIRKSNNAKIKFINLLKNE